MAVVRVLMEGIVGLSYIGPAGGGPTCMIGMDDIESPSKYCLHSSSDNHWKGNKSSFSLDRLGQWNWDLWSVVRNCDVALNGVGGVNPLIPTSLYGLEVIGLWSWPYWLSGPLIGSNGTSSYGYGDKSEACFFIFLLGILQCSSLYDAPLWEAVMRHGPVKG